MYAIVDIAGTQEKVKEGDALRVPLHDAREGATLTFDHVLLIDADASVSIGNPYVAGASVEATVVSHGQGDKVRVVKTHRRKRYKRVKGHRQEYTQVKITKILTA